MTRVHKFLIPVLLVATIVAGGVGCKKKSAESDTKTYLTEGDPANTGASGQVPTSPKNPCTGKGATGVMGLMLKQSASDCSDLTSPSVCGNGNQETGEGCDDGAKNGLAGSLCDIKCQKITTTSPTPETPSSEGAVKITTKSMPDGKLGQTYKATITASGAKGKGKYKWTVTNLPEGYAYASGDDSGSTLKITSKDVVKAVNVAGKPFAPTITVCLESNPSNCAVCSPSVCSFSIKDQYRIEAFPIAANYGGGQNIKAFCSSDDTACGDYVLTATDFLPTAYNTHKLDNVNDPYYVFQLRIKDGSAQLEPVSVPPANEKDKNSYKWDPVKYPDIGFAEEYSKLYYHWSITVDGKPAPFVKWIDYVMGDTKLDTSAQSNIFVMDSTDDMKTTLVYPSMATIMVGPKAMGQTFKNVVVTAVSTNGGSQKIKFGKVTMPSLKEIQAVLDKKVIDAKAVYDACHNMKVEDLKIDKETFAATGSSNSYAITVNNLADQDKTLRVNKKYDGVLKVAGGSGIYTVSNVVYDYDENSISKEGDPVVKIDPNNKANIAIAWAALSSWSSKDYAVSDVTTFDVNDDSAKCKQTVHVTIKRSLKYPDYRDMKIKDIHLIADFATSYTDGDSHVSFEIMGSDGQGGVDTILSTTGELSADGDDPTCFNKEFTLSPKSPAIGDLPVSNVAYVRLGGKDKGAHDMELYFKYLRLELRGNGITKWYAEAAGDFWHDDNHEYDNDGTWEYNNIGRSGDSSAFPFNGLNNSIWFYVSKSTPLSPHPNEGGAEDDGMDCSSYGGEWKN